MNIRITNQLNAIGACITVAQHKDHAPVWTGNEPASSGLDLGELKSG